MYGQLLRTMEGERIVGAVIICDLLRISSRRSLSVDLASGDSGMYTIPITRHWWPL